MAEVPTKESVEELAEQIRADLARIKTLKHIKVEQVVDNPVNSQNPRTWSVQLLNSHAENYPAYVSTWEEWETLKAQYLS